MAAILTVGCSSNGSHPSVEKRVGERSSGMGGGKGHVPQASDTLYTEARAMSFMAREPKRALEIIDSAETGGQPDGFPRRHAPGEGL